MQYKNEKFYSKVIARIPTATKETSLAHRRQGTVKRLLKVRGISRIRQRLGIREVLKNQ